MLSGETRRRSRSYSSNIKSDDPDGVFIGFHGTNAEHAKSIKKGLDPAKAGSEVGLVRGKGFYVSRTIELAEEYAESASKRYETLKTPYGDVDEVRARDGDAGKPTVLRVYRVGGRDAIRRGMTDGHINWGVKDLSGGHARWGDNPWRTGESSEEIGKLGRDLEARILPTDYKYVRFTTNNNDMATRNRAIWPAHTVD